MRLPIKQGAEKKDNLGFEVRIEPGVSYLVYLIAAIPGETIKPKFHCDGIWMITQGNRI